MLARLPPHQWVRKPYPIRSGESVVGPSPLTPADVDIERLLGLDSPLPELAEGPLAGLRLARLHGRLAADEKDATMRAFAAGAIDALVSTTVIEVRVGVPNATTMVLLGADLAPPACCGLSDRRRPDDPDRRAVEQQ